MKKIVLSILIMFIGVLTVNAYSISDLKGIITTGEVTSEFEKQLRNEGCNSISMFVTSFDNDITIAYDIKCEVEKEKITGGEKKMVKEVTAASGSVIYNLNGNVLESKKEMTDKEIEKDPFYARIVQLSPYWGVEMSSRYPQVKKFLTTNHKKEYLQTFAKIFDSCYFQEMGVCYSATPGLGKTTYTGRIQMDDKAVDYALKYLKKEQREINTKQWMLRGIIVAVILAVLILIFKSMGPNKVKKPLKY